MTGAKHFSVVLGKSVFPSRFNSNRIACTQHIRPMGVQASSGMFVIMVVESQ